MSGIDFDAMPGVNKLMQFPPAIIYTHGLFTLQLIILAFVSSGKDFFRNSFFLTCFLDVVPPSLIPMTPPS